MYIIGPATADKSSGRLTRDSRVVSLVIPRFPDFFVRKSIDFFIVKISRNKSDNSVYTTPGKNEQTLGHIKNHENFKILFWSRESEKWIFTIFPDFFYQKMGRKSGNHE